MFTSRFALTAALSFAVFTARADAATLSLVADNIQLGVSDGTTFVVDAGQSVTLGPLISGNFQYTLFPDAGDPATPPFPRIAILTTASVTGFPDQAGPPLNLNAGPFNVGFFSNYTPFGSVTTVTPTFGFNTLPFSPGTYTLNFSAIVTAAVGTPVPVNGSVNIRKSATFTVAGIPEPSPLPGILLLGGTFIAVLQRRHKLNQV